VADQWELRVPTTLVYLQSDASLPVFEVGHADVDLSRKLDEEAKKLGGKLDWRESVVDLLIVLHRPTSIAYRRRLAQLMGCPDDILGAKNTSRLNVWLHDTILRWMEDNKTIPPVKLS
jgi:hypothetical protein